MTIDWTQDPEEIAALESLRQIFRRGGRVATQGCGRGR